MNAAIILSTQSRYIGGDTHPPKLLNRVMLSAAKDLSRWAERCFAALILRCTQDDRAVPYHLRNSSRLCSYRVRLALIASEWNSEIREVLLIADTRRDLWG